MSIRNLDYLRGLASAEFPDLGAKLYEALTDLVEQHQTLSQQVNGNGTGEPLPPPAVSGVKVTGKGGHFSIAIQDEGQIYRDVQYYVEHADNPQFSNPSVIHLGHTRNHNVFLGNVTRYWRAYSAYASSPAGPPAYHGSVGAPQPVVGGGAIEGPEMLPSEGSGTGARGEGLSGPGPVPFRSKTGAAPVRGVMLEPSGSEGGLNVASPSAAGLPPGGAVSGGGGGGGGGATGNFVLGATALTNVGAIPKVSAAGTVAESSIHDDGSGHVGVGIAAPSNTLSVGEDLGAIGVPSIALGSTSANVRIVAGQGAANNLGLRWIYNATPANAYAWFVTAGYTNPLRIDGSIVALQASGGGGNVGIGTLTPHSKLAVTGLSTYANNAAAVAAGLAAGDFYRDNGDPDHVCVVH